MLELGRAIAHQLDIDAHGELLPRWMAQHLAELIQAAECSEGAAKQMAEERAVELIIKLWTNRRALPGNADPLNGYLAAIKTLSVMQPSADPWRWYRPSSSSEELLHDMFCALVDLVMSGLLLTRPLEMRRIQDVEWNALSKEEQLLVELLERWHEFVVAPAPSKINLEDLYSAYPGSREVDSGGDVSTPGDESAGEDEGSPEIDRRAILSHVETFQARLASLIEKWRKTLTEDSASGESN